MPPGVQEGELPPEVDGLVATSCASAMTSPRVDSSWAAVRVRSPWIRADHLFASGAARHVLSTTAGPRRSSMVGSSTAGAVPCCRAFSTTTFSALAPDQLACSRHRGVTSVRIWPTRRRW